MGRLRDKVILITGASGAIGSAVAEAVVRNGGHRDRDAILPAARASITRSTSRRKTTGSA